MVTLPESAKLNKETVVFEDLGRRDYKSAWDYQELLLKTNVEKKAAFHHLQATGIPADVALLQPATRHHLLFVEHPHVYTLGKSGKIEHVLISESERQQKQIEFFHTNRGGDITYHGPGQLVGYPILDLEKFYTDIGRFLRNIEEVIIQTIAVFGLKGDRSPGETGVWLDPDLPGRERKICAIGVRCSRWITMHGFAFNVNPDLGYFNYIVPCGISNKKVTSLSRELGYAPPMEDVKQIVREKFVEVFNIRLAEDEHDILIKDSNFNAG